MTSSAEVGVVRSTREVVDSLFVSVTAADAPTGAADAMNALAKGSETPSTRAAERGVLVVPDIDEFLFVSMDTLDVSASVCMSRCVFGVCG